MPTATAAEIRAAYRQLALCHHPDVSPLGDSTRLFAGINEAYSTLSDPNRRAQYDRMLALNSSALALKPLAASHHAASSSSRAYVHLPTGRVYPSMNSFYLEWRRRRGLGIDPHPHHM